MRISKKNTTFAPMKIAIVGSYPLSAEYICGGVEASVYGLAHAVVRAGLIVEVFDLPRIDGQDSFELSGALAVHRYINEGIYNRDAIKRMADICCDIANSHCNVAHIHGTGHFSNALYRAIKKQGVPVVLTIHGLQHEERKQTLYKQPSLKHLYQYIVQSKAEFALLNEAEEVIVDTPYVARKIEQYYEKRKIARLPLMHIIPQGIAPSFYALSPDEQSNTILSVGAISPRKGHIYTVQAFNKLREQGIEATLRIVGTIADRDYYYQLQQQIESSPYREEISLETDVAQPELLAAYEHAKLFVLHSREESQGIVFAEAMAAGLPVVATKVGGVGDVVEHGQSGFLCPFGDIQSMAEKMAELLSDPVLWHSCSLQARKAAEKYRWDSIAEQVLRLYKG